MVTLTVKIVVASIIIAHAIIAFKMLWRVDVWVIASSFTPSPLVLDRVAVLGLLMQLLFHSGIILLLSIEKGLLSLSHSFIFMSTTTWSSTWFPQLAGRPTTGVCVLRSLTPGQELFPQWLLRYTCLYDWCVKRSVQGLGSNDSAWSFPHFLAVDRAHIYGSQFLIGDYLPRGRGYITSSTARLLRLLTTHCYVIILEHDLLSSLQPSLLTRVAWLSFLLGIVTSQTCHIVSMLLLLVIEQLLWDTPLVNLLGEAFGRGLGGLALGDNLDWVIDVAALDRIPIVFIVYRESGFLVSRISILNVFEIFNHAIVVLVYRGRSRIIQVKCALEETIIIVIDRFICPVTVVTGIGPSSLILLLWALFQRLAWADHTAFISGNHVLARRLRSLLGWVYVCDWELLLILDNGSSASIWYHWLTLFSRATTTWVWWLVSGHGESELLWDLLDHAYVSTRLRG